MISIASFFVFSAKTQIEVLVGVAERGKSVTRHYICNFFTPAHFQNLESPCSWDPPPKTLKHYFLDSAQIATMSQETHGKHDFWKSDPRPSQVPVSRKALSRKNKI